MSNSCSRLDFYLRVSLEFSDFHALLLINKMISYVQEISFCQTKYDTEITVRGDIFSL